MILFLDAFTFLAVRITQLEMDSVSHFYLFCSPLCLVSLLSFPKYPHVLSRAASPDSPPVIAAPSMWTRPQIKDFKEKIRQDVDSVITVGRGEVVTVRVPTHEEGSYLFWEFATDHYDIGFGVFFEWTDSTNASVSVHVSESSDEDEDEDGEETLVQYPRCMGRYYYLLFVYDN